MRLSKRLLSAVALTILAAFTPVAHADTLTFDFATVTAPFTSYTQDGFTVTQAQDVGQFYEDLTEGNPAGSLLSGSSFGSADSVVIVSDGGNPFYFDSFDLDAFNASAEWELDGINADINPLALLYSTSGIDFATSSNPGIWQTEIDTATEFFGGPPALATSVAIRVSDLKPETAFAIDNIVVEPAPTTITTTVTPEPSSLILLGTGLLGTLAAARRRLTV